MNKRGKGPRPLDGPFRGECKRTVLGPEIGECFSCYTQLFIGWDNVYSDRGICTGNHSIRSGAALIFFIIQQNTHML